MAERAATLVDRVLPRVPVRQWVLTLPYRLRYRLAWDHGLCRAVLGIHARALLAFYARTARTGGIGGGQTRTLTVIQRFGGGLNLNVHFHTLVLDGVFTAAQPDDVLAFGRTEAPKYLAPMTWRSYGTAGRPGAQVVLYRIRRIGALSTAP